MALLVENGSGVAGANSYVTAEYVTAYLTERNRASEGGWTSPEGSEEDAACIAATDYVENRFRLRFRGQKEFSTVSQARATWTATAQPDPGDTVTIGSQVYTFQSTLSGAADVLIGASLSATIDNLVDAINANSSTEGTSFSSGLAANDDATAVTFIDDAFVAFARATGTAGNAVAVSTTVTDASWNGAALFGGSDIAIPQPLSFPRVRLYDRDGNPIYGVPERVKHATAEYAVRARAAALAPDPTTDALGGTVTSLREKVGPIETATEYLPGSAGSGTLPSYPAADRLLAEFLMPSGGVLR